MPTTDAPELRFRDNRELNRYEALLGETVAGFSEYQLDPDRLAFLHTEVDPAYEGRGVGSALAAWAVADVRARGLRIVPKCPFIRAWLRRHPG